MHLGDIVHPLPFLNDYNAAADAAARLHENFDCPLYLTPGNHDIGDKASPWMPAKAVKEDWIDNYKQRFGAVFLSFAWADCRFILICSPLFGTGLPIEARQREWLEQELEEHAQARLFLATHYPPYLLRPGEPDHYDNIGLRERNWFLGLMERFNVEALFFGHIHNFLYNRHGGSHCYGVPSVSFVRRDYAELFRVAPMEEDEFGRNDRGRLGYFVVDVFDSGHVVRPISTDGAVNREPGRQFWTPGRHPVEVSQTALGVHLRHAWNEVVELPYNSPTDEFQRRAVRNDYPLLALWQSGVGHLRIPLAEFSSPDSSGRLAALQGAGMRYTAFTAGVTDDRQTETLRRHARMIDGWEVVLPSATIAADLPAIEEIRRRTGLNTTISPLISSRDEFPANKVFMHALWSGANPADPAAAAKLVSALGVGPAVDRVGFRVGPGTDPWDGVKASVDLSARVGCGAAVTVCLSPEGPDDACLDEIRLANRVAIAALAAAARPMAVVYLDTFMDFDRGYFVRLGLADRKGSLRRPGRVAARMHALLEGLPPEGEIVRRSLGRGDELIAYSSDDFELALYLPAKSETVPLAQIAQMVSLLPSREAFVALSLDSGEVAESFSFSAPGQSLSGPVAVLPAEQGRALGWTHPVQYG